MLIPAFVKAFEQLGDRRIRGVLIKSLIIALILYVGLVGGISVALRLTAISAIGWLEQLIDAALTLIAIVAGLYFMPAIVTLISSLFLDEIADEVERTGFPQAGPPRRQSVLEALRTGVLFAIKSILINLAALFVFVWFLPLLPFAFLAINGYLLGQEYFDMVAARRLAPAEVRAMRKRNGSTLWFAGMGFAFLMTIPIVNVLMPVVATAAMVHLYHGLAARRPADAPTSPNV